MQNIERPEKISSHQSYYQKVRIKRNIKKLGEYIEYLAGQLDKDKIIEFYNSQKGPLYNHFVDIDMPYLINYSYYGSIIIDILWANDITITEAMYISAGRLKLESLGKKLPSKINELKIKILPFFKNNKIGKKHYSTLKEAVDCLDKKINKGANLLLLTSVEGIVRDLGSFLIQKQNLNIDINDREYNSLDSFLRKIEWKNDYEISKIRLSLLTGNYELFINRDSNDFLQNEQISLKTRLDFLRRRFKEDRDLILHGVESDYGKEWHLFVNLSALSQIYETVKYYLKKYK